MCALSHLIFGLVKCRFFLCSSGAHYVSYNNCIKTYYARFLNKSHSWFYNSFSMWLFALISLSCLSMAVRTCLSRDNIFSWLFHWGKWQSFPYNCQFPIVLQDEIVRLPIFSLSCVDNFTCEFMSAEDLSYL